LDKVKSLSPRYKMELSQSKVAIVTGSYGATTETFVTRHVNHLNGGETVVLSRQYTRDAKVEHPVHYIKPAWWYSYSSPIRKLIQIPHFLRYGENRVPDRREKKQIQQFLKRNRVKSILAEFGPHGCMVLPVAEEVGIPVFTYFRGYDASKSLNDWKVRHAYRKIIPRMAGIFAVSPHLLDNLKNIGVDWKQAHVIPSGTDSELFKPGNKDPNLLLSVGRFVKKKSPDITLQAFAEILSMQPGLQLVMIGEGPLLDYCKSLADSLGIEKNVTFTGAQSNHLVREYMAKASLFLLHSVTAENGDTEGFPSVIQEAMASGCAVVSTRHGGIPHFIEDGVDGLLVDEFDLEAYVNSLKNLLNNQNYCKSIRENARATAVNKFEYRALYRKLESILAN